VVWRLDRLGRSLRHLIEVVTGLHERGVGFRPLRESIDTTTAGGRLVFHLFGALVQFEREIIRDRTVAGLAAARARGRVGGRPFKLVTCIDKWPGSRSAVWPGAGCTGTVISSARGIGLRSGSGDRSGSSSSHGVGGHRVAASLKARDHPVDVGGRPVGRHQVTGG